MNTNSEPVHWLDVVFEHRNKLYGAYVIRIRYPGYLLSAMAIALITLLVSLSIPRIEQWFSNGDHIENVLVKTVRYTDLAPPPPIDKNTPPPPKLEIPPPVKEVIKFLPPKVTEKEVVEEKMPTVAEVKKSDAGAQDVDAADNVVFDEPVKAVVEDSDDKIYMVVEQSPEFDGGMEALMKFLQKHLEYPVIARRMNLEGTVYVGFVVDKDGSITNVQAIKGFQEDCDKEAVRVVGLMPKWKPGKQNGKPVNVRFVLPIRFILN